VANQLGFHVFEWLDTVRIFYFVPDRSPLHEQPSYKGCLPPSLVLCSVHHVLWNQVDRIHHDTFQPSLASIFVRRKLRSSTELSEIDLCDPKLDIVYPSSVDISMGRHVNTMRQSMDFTWDQSYSPTKIAPKKRQLDSILRKRPHYTR
jgi:hypothetical protein